VTLDPLGNLYLTTNQGGDDKDCDVGCGTVIEIPSGGTP
jgi:hypothetical protein